MFLDALDGRNVIVILFDGWKSATFNVSLNVKVGKEAQKHDGIEAHDVCDDFWVIAFDEEKLCRVNEDGDELDHLHGGQMLFPPQILLVFGAHGR